MIERNLAPVLRQTAELYPVLLLVGPRQSGKTTLCRGLFADLPYVSLEPLDWRETAIHDPRGFLDEYRRGAVFDEVQHAPALLSYLQEEVDADATPGRFVLTGSQHFGLTGQVTQSLASRCGVFTLLPLGWDELQRFPDPPQDLFEASCVAAELLKRQVHAGLPARLRHYRESRGLEDRRSARKRRQTTGRRSQIRGHCRGRVFPIAGKAARPASRRAGRYRLWRQRNP